jgi:1-acyl-sn-glycerol-3-phosphate acyltransferase
MAIGFVVVVAATGLLGVLAIALAHINPRMHLITRVMRLWGRIVLLFGAVRVSVTGSERLDPDGSYMLVSNHQSAIDPPLHIAKLPVSIRFLAKKELFKFPIFGSAMRAVGMVETDRSAHASAHRAINEQVARVMGMEKSLIIYPEGTRTRDGEMKPFKKGAFRIAVDNGLPIVPLTLHGAFHVWPPGSKICLGGRVTLVIHEPIPTEGLGREDLEDLRDRVWNQIAAGLEELPTN